ncbi:hypothetical protein [Sphingobium cupriresistens]|uniref:Uncharacterized protein n=1 Tax=Sphingobium cupriresistens LL01 TaxID=1420583 RepID=A0A0J7XS64_9SPHN|nr:hypothetical protein [Sphingobium cupriresistens]KMS54711.1 hypothetical protein V473_15285 [Sphingobium cupriresistens LL01]
MIVQDKVLTAWLAIAKQGETLVYARATALSVKSPVAARVRALAETGHVVLCQQRRAHGPGDENFRFIVRRTGKALPAADGSRKVVGVRPLPAHKPQDKRTGACASVARDIAPHVRSILAEGGRRSAETIARELGLYSAQPVRVVMERLAA